MTTHATAAASPSSSADRTPSLEQFRDALRHFPSGVTIVTIRTGHEVHGLTVSAFASVSGTPPMVLVVVQAGGRGHALLERPGAAFAVNILARDQRHLSDRFAGAAGQPLFARGRWGEAVTGAPVLEDALAWLDCEIFSRTRAGSHTIYVGTVKATGVPRAGGEPLVYWNRAYRHLPMPGHEPGRRARRRRGRAAHPRRG